MFRDEQGLTWYKGNLHTHTTLSDGVKTPEEAAALYRSKGYDFLALTDHWKHSQTRMEDGLLLLAGCEYDVGTRARDGIYHIVSVGMSTPPVLEKRPGLTAGEVLDAVHGADGFAILAHPAWSLNNPLEISKLRGVDAAEVYNTMSGAPWNGRRADSSVILDTVAAMGSLLPLVSADDAHFYTGEQCVSYIMLQADTLSSDRVMEALRAKRFYASQGPTMTVWREGDWLRVRCSPVRDIVFYSDLVWSSDRVQRGDGLIEAQYPIRKEETFLRVELMDENGRMAWSSPISLEQRAK